MTVQKKPAKKKEEPTEAKPKTKTRDPAPTLLAKHVRPGTGGQTM